MKPDRLQLTNWMCHRHLDLPLTPLTLVGGGNDRGKSAIRDAFAFALSGETARITAKSERPQLIAEGESKGAVALTIGPWAVSRNIKDGKAAVSGELPLPVDASRDVLVEVLPYCLAPERWVAGDGAERRAALMTAMRVPVTPERVKAIMAERGVIEITLKLLPDAKGLDDWLRIAETFASEGRGGWKAITGEVYGAAKAETWTAPRPAEAPTDDQLAAAEHAVTTAAAGLRITEAAMSNARVAEHLASGEGERLRNAMQEQTLLIEAAIPAKAAADQKKAEAEAVLQAVDARMPTPPLSCPHCKGHILRNTRGALEAYAPPANPATTEERQAATTALQAAIRAQENADSDLRLLQVQKAQAEKMLAALPKPGTEVSEGPGVTDAEAAVARAQQGLLDARAALTKLASDAAVARDADLLTHSAMAEHTSVKVWVRIRDMVAPTGIPGELLGKAITPFNDTLRAFAEETGWPQVAIREDMTITSGGRLYNLCSASRKWRADAMIAIALAGHSGLGMVLLDNADVLEPSAREVLLSWLLELIGGGLDCAVVFMTLRAPPPAPPEVAVHWLGTNADEQRAEAA